MIHGTLQAADGRWHAVYRLPGTRVSHSIGDAPTERAAREMAREANEEHRRNTPPTLPEPLDRPIPAGFYTDDDAA